MSEESDAYWTFKWIYKCSEILGKFQIASIFYPSPFAERKLIIFPEFSEDWNQYFSAHLDQDWKNCTF